jgi:hypothetical protein
LAFHRFWNKAAVVLRIFVLCSAVSCFAPAQVTTTDFGPLAVNAATPLSKTLSFNFTGLVAAPRFSLRWELDFTQTASSCSTSWTSCTVTVNFTAKYPGLRQDAVRVTDSGGRVIATAFLHGMGVGPQLVFSPGMISIPPVGSPSSFFGGAVTVDQRGAAYFLDSSLHVLKRLDPMSKTAVIIAGREGVMFPPGDNGPATSATLSNPRAVTIDGAGNIFVLDGDRVRKIDAITGIISTFAGGGYDSGEDVPPTSVRLLDAVAICVDAAGNVYVLEGSARSVRKVDAVTGRIRTVAGNHFDIFSGDGGPATSAGLYRPRSIAVNGAGDLFIAEADGRIRKVSVSTGLIETIAGTGVPGYSGDGGPATLAQLGDPGGLAVDGLGNLYIAGGSFLVRKIDASTGIISTIAGNPLGQAPGEGYAADDVQLAFADGLAVDPSGNLYLTTYFGAVEVVSNTPTLRFPWPGTFGAPPVIMISLTNIGNQELKLDSQALTGPFALQLSGQQQCNIPEPLAPGASCSTSIAYVPEQGTASGLFSVTSDALNVRGSEQSAALEIGYPQVQLSISTIAFGSAGVGSFGGNRWVTITNSGNVPLVFQSFQFTGANPSDFDVDASGCSLKIPPRSGCSIDIFFRPQGTGPRSASLAITDNAAVSPQMITVTGTGLAPANVLATPSQLDFGPQTIGTTSAPQIVTLTNTGEVPLTLDSPYGPAEFNYFAGITSLPLTLGPGASIQLPISFTPKVTGSKAGPFTFRASNSSKSVGAVTLTGTAVSWTAPGNLTQLSIAPDGTPWGINSAGGIYTFNASAQDWTPVPGDLSQVAAGPDGVVWGLNGGGYIYRWNPSRSQWDSIPGNLVEISVGMDGDAWGINGAHSVYHFDNAVEDWEQVPGVLSTISVGFDGAVWGLGLNGEIFRLRVGAKVFERVPGQLAQISVGGDGEVWGLDTTGSIYHFNSLTRVWDQIPGWLSEIAVGRDGNVWGINSAGFIYQYQPGARTWNQIPGQLSKIAVAANGAVWGLNGAGQIYQLVTRFSAAQSFQAVSGSMEKISVGPDNNVWGIVGSGAVGHFNPLTQVWNFMPANLRQIAVGDGGNVWGLDSSGAIYRFDAARQDWTNIPGQLSRIAVGAAGDVWGINSVGYIYRFNPAVDNWDALPGNLTQLSVGADGAVWGINSAGAIYRFNGMTQDWDWIPGSLSQIAVGSSRDVWGINSAGFAYRFNPQIGDWEATPGKFSQISVAFDGSVWAVAFPYEGWQYNYRSASWDRIPGLVAEIVAAADAAVWGIFGNSVSRLR